uniref:AlNc14C192G8483 protein n=1 Tax=Albugo laibachii Nc14 TaxID=890382 RepID=F0WQ03_9STRA|nr:AlNc14C192G8483 [Albugo laibachii Nc14]|eukprot:CCA23406.1 AlNc14C192G8483 [Albugo laibachii Nc14]
MKAAMQFLRHEGMFHQANEDTRHEMIFMVGHRHFHSSLKADTKLHVQDYIVSENELHQYAQHREMMTLPYQTIHDVYISGHVSGMEYHQGVYSRDHFGVGGGASESISCATEETEGKRPTYGSEEKASGWMKGVTEWLVKARDWGKIILEHSMRKGNALRKTKNIARPNRKKWRKDKIFSKRVYGFAVFEYNHTAGTEEVLYYMYEYKNGEYKLQEKLEVIKNGRIRLSTRAPNYFFDQICLIRTCSS